MVHANTCRCCIRSYLPQVVHNPIAASLNRQPLTTRFLCCAIQGLYFVQNSLHLLVGNVDFESLEGWRVLPAHDCYRFVVWGILTTWGILSLGANQCSFFPSTLSCTKSQHDLTSTCSNVCHHCATDGTTDPPTPQRVQHKQLPFPALDRENNPNKATSNHKKHIIYTAYDSHCIWLTRPLHMADSREKNASHQVRIPREQPVPHSLWTASNVRMDAVKTCRVLVLHPTTGIHPQVATRHHLQLLAALPTLVATQQHHKLALIAQLLMSTMVCGYVHTWVCTRVPDKTLITSTAFRCVLPANHCMSAANTYNLCSAQSACGSHPARATTVS